VVAAVEQRKAKIRIIAVEAIPEKAEHLHSKFKAVTVHACAAGEREGRALFYVDTRQSGLSSLSRRLAAGDDVQEIHVPIRRLDELIAATDVDAVKIDVEGAELGVLLGSTRMLQNCRPVVMFESAPGDAPGLGYTKPAIWNFFSESRYTLHVPNRVAHNDEGMSLASFAESHAYPQRTINYFAIPAERRSEIQRRARRVSAR
jgi:FkbM family methyltransferase